jgi:hypothetical protein
MPVYRRNTVAKYWLVEKPSPIATPVTDAPGRASRRFASSTFRMTM